MRSLARAAATLALLLAHAGAPARAQEGGRPSRPAARESTRAAAASGRAHPAPARPSGPPAKPQQSAAAEGDDPAVVRLRFAWPAAANVQATQRRTRVRTGHEPSTTTTRFTQRLERRDGALRISTAGTTWEGDAPYRGPPGAVDGVMRAAETVVQVVSPEGEFQGLEGVEALRPAMARLLEGSVPPEQVERALGFAEAAMRGAGARDVEPRGGLLDRRGPRARRALRHARRGGGAARRGARRSSSRSSRCGGACRARRAIPRSAASR